MTKLIPLDHLMEACGTDHERLAGLALLIAYAAYGMGCMGNSDQRALDQVNDFQRVARELERRVKA